MQPAPGRTDGADYYVPQVIPTGASPGPHGRSPSPGCGDARQRTGSAIRPAARAQSPSATGLPTAARRPGRGPGPSAHPGWAASTGSGAEQRQVTCRCRARASLSRSRARRPRVAMIRWRPFWPARRISTIWREVWEPLPFTRQHIGPLQKPLPLMPRFCAHTKTKPLMLPHCNLP